MVVRGQGVVVAELAELELLVAAVAEVAEGSHAVSRAGVPMGYWVGDEKMGVDCNNTPKFPIYYLCEPSKWFRRSAFSSQH